VSDRCHWSLHGHLVRLIERWTNCTALRDRCLHRLSWLVPCGFALFFFDFIYLLSLGGGAAGPWLIGVSLVSLAAIPIRSILLLMTVSMLCGYILFDRMKRTYEAWLNAELAGPTPTLCFAEDAITVDEWMTRSGSGRPRRRCGGRIRWRTVGGR
jgi:hypothetical protein